jgi:hypothetical protein
LRGGGAFHRWQKHRDLLNHRSRAGPEYHGRVTLDRHFRLPLALLAAAALVCLATVWAPPAGRTSWLLEVGPGLAGIAVLIATARHLSLAAFEQREFAPDREHLDRFVRLDAFSNFQQ